LFDSTVLELCIHFKVIYLGWSAERAVVSVSFAPLSACVCQSIAFITIGRLSRNANELHASAADIPICWRIIIPTFPIFGGFKLEMIFSQSPDWLWRRLKFHVELRARSILSKSAHLWPFSPFPLVLWGLETGIC